jgi:hypothetical protein
MSRTERPSPADLTAASYRKSSYSGANNECVEVAELADKWVGIRDSKDPAGPALLFSTDAFTAFVQELKSGRFHS